MADSKSFFSAVESRRTIYQLSHESPIPDARIKEIVTFALKHTPSSFNSQTSRVVLVLKKKHQELWDAIAEVYKAMLPEDKFNHAKQKFDGFRAGYGTVSSLTSRRLQGLYADNPGYRFSSMKTPPTCVNSRRNTQRTKTSSLNVSLIPSHNCPPANTLSSSGSEHTSGMLQYVIWTALEAEGMGVNLQHYNPPIDPRLENEYGVPPTWSLKSQMVFGKPTGGPMEKTFKPIEKRMKVFE
jgi:predicted oxidoreductase (fatty acid repression mutant protein)